MLSQMPWVILASVLAEQGAMSTTSAQRRSWTDSGSQLKRDSPLRIPSSPQCEESGPQSS